MGLGLVSVPRNVSLRGAYRIAQAAWYCNVSVNDFRDWVRKGLIRPRILPGHKLKVYLRKDLDTVLDRLPSALCLTKIDDVADSADPQGKGDA